jgi:DNA-binding transcriptional MerR regulator
MVQHISVSLRSGTLAKAAGVSADTIRHYERIGVLPRATRTESGYRIFPASALQRVQVVRRALRIGFTLAELSEVLKVRDSGGAPCGRVFEMAQEKLKGISADIEALRRTERYLKRVLSDWESRMDQAGAGEKSHLLYSLSEAVGRAEAGVTRSTTQLRRRKKS